jgi:hypothetical protein
MWPKDLLVHSSYCRSASRGPRGLTGRPQFRSDRSIWFETNWGRGQHQSVRNTTTRSQGSEGEPLRPSARPPWWAGKKAKYRRTRKRASGTSTAMSVRIRLEPVHQGKAGGNPANVERFGVRQNPVQARVKPRVGETRRQNRVKLSTAARAEENVSRPGLNRGSRLFRFYWTTSDR